MSKWILLEEEQPPKGKHVLGLTKFGEREVVFLWSDEPEDKKDLVSVCCHTYMQVKYWILLEDICPIAPEEIKLVILEQDK